MERASRSRHILGLDPGLARVGYAVVAAESGGLRALTYGVIHTKADCEHAARIDQIATAVEELLVEYSIDEAALEELFFARNVTSALNVAQARGALILVLERAGVPIVTCAPSSVKLAVCGNGRASKREVARMSARLLGLQEPPAQADAADALAIAITASRILPVAAEIA